MKLAPESIRELQVLRRLVQPWGQLEAEFWMVISGRCSGPWMSAAFHWAAVLSTAEPRSHLRWRASGPRPDELPPLPVLRVC